MYATSYCQIILSDYSLLYAETKFNFLKIKYITNLAISFYF